MLIACFVKAFCFAEGFFIYTINFNARKDDL